jgi:hypothetical protein
MNHQGLVFLKIFKKLFNLKYSKIEVLVYETKGGVLISLDWHL